MKTITNLSVYALSLFGLLALSTSCSTDDSTDTTSNVESTTNLTGRSVAVTSTNTLKTALTNANSGDVITLAAGTYTGPFKISKSGTSSSRITIQGPSTGVAVIQNGTSATASSTVFEIAGKYITLVGNITVRYGNIGVKMVDADNSIVDGVKINNIGQEGIHLLD